jgi:hypothetical protein
MVGGVAFDGFAEEPQVAFGGGFFGLLDVAGKLGQHDRGEDAENGHDDEQFN